MKRNVLNFFKSKKQKTQLKVGDKIILKKPIGLLTDEYVGAYFCIDSIDDKLVCIHSNFGKGMVSLCDIDTYFEYTDDEFNEEFEFDEEY